MIFFELFYTFFLIGLFTFGGGYAMIPMIEEQVVSKGWVSESALTDFIAVSESTPGPFALNISTFVGNSVGGVFGAICATVGVILPSLIIIVIIAMIMKKFMKNKYVQGALGGVRPIVLALILSTTIVLTIKVIFFRNNSLQGEFEFLVIYRKTHKKSLGSLKLLGLSALLGIIIFTV